MVRDRHQQMAERGEAAFGEILERNPWFCNVKNNKDNPFAHYDYSFDWSPDGTTEIPYIVEVKGRRFPSDHKYAKEGVFLEAQKFFDLMPYVYAKRQVRYVNVFDDGAIYMWNLNTLIEEKPPVEYREMNYHTADEGTIKVTKGVIRLDIDKAIKLNQLWR